MRKKAARKAAFGLAASAAVLGALSGGHGESDRALTYVGDHQPSTALASPGGEAESVPALLGVQPLTVDRRSEALQMLRNHGYHDTKWPGDSRYPDILPAREMLLKLLPGHTA